MCKPTKPPQRYPSVLLTTKDYTQPPTSLTSLISIAVYVAILSALEKLWNNLLSNYQHLHPILLTESNRNTLVRHLGTEGVCCLAISGLAVYNRHLVADLLDGFWQLFHKTDDNKVKTTLKGSYHVRLFTHIPVAHQILLLFLAFQVKNTYDSWLWNDGPEFIAHHVFAGCVAWGGMHPGMAHYYAIFFMGLSEVSTLVLIFLANFDEKVGVPGLEHAFPLIRIVLAALFALSFIFFRVMLWPYASYHFTRDAWAALSDKKKGAPGQTCRGWLWTMMISLCGLSVLQVVWLFQILIMGKQEVVKLIAEAGV